MLNDKQKIFCIEYSKDFNGSAAALRAGYSSKRSKVTASELLDKADVQAEITTIINIRAVSAKKSADDIIRELESIAFAKTTDFVKVKDITVGKGKDRKKVRVAYIELTTDLGDEQQRAISEIKQTKDGISLKTHDKVKSLELLGRHHGIFEKDNEQAKPVLFSKKVTFK